ncbi:hypothetical protein JMN32_25240 [Fulvivirga sp. 29W222]|uniref:Uncharacterized protein n=1 Tax=Fulvivirga marina TaxID=2494733 RepID=A0A937G450_9BACT|nr:hypothetical protein [Fulvivirga marina]MBL6449640.1 hypothetical protein [Fulvivirga marina]
MENNTLAWEESVQRYQQLLEALNQLVQDTSRLAETYESTNMDFAQLIYENGLYELMNKADQLTVYERSFEFMYYSMKGQVEQLKHLRETLQLFLIKDPVNIPRN